MKRKHLYYVAAVIWGIPGITITIKGISVKHIPAIQSAFIASFYSGLGPMLLVSSFRFILFHY